MAERLIAAVLKTAVRDERTGGSNPSPSALARFCTAVLLRAFSFPKFSIKNAFQRFLLPKSVWKLFTSTFVFQWLMKDRIYIDCNDYMPSLSSSNLLSKSSSVLRTLVLKDSQLSPMSSPKRSRSADNSARVACS